MNPPVTQLNRPQAAAPPALWRSPLENEASNHEDKAFGVESSTGSGRAPSEITLNTVPRFNDATRRGPQWLEIGLTGRNGPNAGISEQPPRVVATNMTERELLRDLNMGGRSKKDQLGSVAESWGPVPQALKGMFEIEHDPPSRSTSPFKEIEDIDGGDDERDRSHTRREVEIAMREAWQRARAGTPYETRRVETSHRQTQTFPSQAFPCAIHRGAQKPRERLIVPTQISGLRITGPGQTPNQPS